MNYGISHDKVHLYQLIKEVIDNSLTAKQRLLDERAGEAKMSKEKEVIWWPGAEMEIDYSLTIEENRKRHEAKKKEFAEKYPECVLYAN